ncbi:DUF1016 N-terminal domain-containing protein [Thermodesulfobacteriota bacterium]
MRKEPTLYDYASFLEEIKTRIRRAQVKAVWAVNSELVRHYWGIGHIIDERQRREGWGASVIPRLAKELRNELPELKGFSERNIKLMLAFYREYPNPAEIVQQPAAQMPPSEKSLQSTVNSVPNPIVQPPVAQLPDSLFWALPWAHHVILIQKVKNLSVRRWYMEQTLANGWSRIVLSLMIANLFLQSKIVHHRSSMNLEAAE